MCKDIGYQLINFFLYSHALALHGKPRHTGDLDICINISEHNARLMLRVIKDFGMASLGSLKIIF